MAAHQEDDDNAEAEANEQSLLVSELESLTQDVSFVGDTTTLNLLMRTSVAVLLLVLLPLVGFYLMENARAHIPPQGVLGVYLFATHIAYILHLALVVRNADLYRIRPEYGNVRGWSLIRVQKGVKQFPRFAIESISELSCIRGTVTHLSLLLVSFSTFCIYFTVFLYEIKTWRQTLHEMIGAALIYIGSVGIMTLAMFELNPYHRASRVIHYVGCVACSLCNVGLIVSDWFKNIGFIVLGVIALLCGAIYIFIFITANLPSDDARYVSSVSKKCLLFEGFVFFCSFSAIDCYLASSFFR